jgi:hypothetical protein
MNNYSYSLKHYNHIRWIGKSTMLKQKAFYDRLLLGREVFGSFEAADILKVKRSILNNDMKQGYLPEGTRVEWGKTVRTVFSRQELYWVSLFYQLNAIGLTKRHAHQIVRSISAEPHDYILLKAPPVHGETTTAVHFKNYLSVQALDEINKTGATIIINYKKIREALDSRFSPRGDRRTGYR